MVPRGQRQALGVDGFAGGGVARGRDRIHHEMARAVEHHLEREPKRFFIAASVILSQISGGQSFNPSVL